MLEQAIQEECENACFRTIATRFLVLSIYGCRRTRHIEEARRLKVAQQWKTKAKKQRETAARDRLAAAITVDTAEATAEDLVRNHAGDPRAFPSIVDRGIALAASRAAVDQLRPHVKRYHVAERNHREKARTDQQHLDAVKRAVEGFRQWWRGGGLFRRKSAGETIVKQVIAAVWPTHWKEAYGRSPSPTRRLSRRH